MGLLESDLCWGFGNWNSTTNNENDNIDYGHLQKSAQAVTKLCQNLSSYKNDKVRFSNWFTTLELMLYLKNKKFLQLGQ